MAKWQYTKGLHDIGEGLYAYLVPDGSWGWSNAGLVADGGEALLVDTLFDLPLTSEMLAAMRSRVPAAKRIGALVNTHGNGDHTFGNQLLEGSRIIAAQGCVDDMKHRPPEQYAGWMREWPNMGLAGKFWHEVIGSRFDFSGIRLTLPNETFAGELMVKVGDKEVRLVEVGPAHTRGDVLVYVPSDRVVYTGDMLFVNCHPAIWAGPVTNWIKACDLMLSWDVDVVVPGHGPITDKSGVHELRDYLAYLLAEARTCYDAGLTFQEASEKISLDRWAKWTEDERMYVNVHACYREFAGASAERPDVMQMLGLMGQRYFEQAAAARERRPMKLATFAAPGGAQRIGALLPGEKRVADLTASADDPAFADMLALIDGGPAALERARAVAAKPKVVHDLAAVTLLAPLPVPRRIRDFLCFELHVRQSRANRYLFGMGTERLDPAKVEIAKVWYERPVYYKGNCFSVVGHGAEVHWPSYSRVIDYELEIGVVLGRRGKNVPRDEALSYAFGYTIFNDFSARDEQYIEMQGMLGPAKGKDFDTGNSFGPWITTADEIADPQDFTMIARVNGEEWSRGSSRTMRHTFADIIAYSSAEETLYPGEVLGSGTVGGGCGNELGRFMKHGDVIELEVSGIGVLRNTIVAPHVPAPPAMPIKIL